MKKNALFMKRKTLFKKSLSHFGDKSKLFPIRLCTEKTIEFL